MIESKSLFSFVLFFLASYGISFNYTLSFSFFFSYLSGLGFEKCDDPIRRGAKK
jgi:hypothetical protein